MKVIVRPENIIERIGLAMGRVPTPIFDTLMTIMLARTIMVATKHNVFETLAPGPLTAGEVAKQCKTHPRATKKLLDALVGCGYLDIHAERYSITSIVKRWLLKENPQSLYDNILFRFLEWDLIENYENFLQTGEPLDIHESLSDDQEWNLYQRGMRSLAGPSASEVAQRTPVPAGARDMLDIGGSHGYNSVVLCRRHRDLRAVVLDLPDAVRHAESILAKENMGDRVVHRSGNALKDDLGSEAWDLVFIANLVHHFDDSTNRKLAQRVARSLRPGGCFVIQELIRPRSPKKVGQAGALLDLYFALTSESGTWSYEEMAEWQREAGLVPQKPIKFRSLPGIGQQVAIKSES